MLKPGLKLVCLDDVFPAWAKVFYTQLPVKGQIYTLREFGTGVNVINIGSNEDNSVRFDGNKEYNVWVEELVNPIWPNSQKEMGFKSSRFAPVEQITEEDFIEQKDVISKPVRLPVPKIKELELV